MGDNKAWSTRLAQVFKIGSCGPLPYCRELNKMTAIEMYLRGSRSSAMWKPERSDGKFHFEA